MPFTRAPKYEILGINLTESMKYLYAENCKIPMKEIKKEQINGEIHHFHGLGHSI